MTKDDKEILRLIGWAGSMDSKDLITEWDNYSIGDLLHDLKLVYRAGFDNGYLSGAADDTDVTGFR
jgi:hypothetical protein